MVLYSQKVHQIFLVSPTCLFYLVATPRQVKLSTSERPFVTFIKSYNDDKALSFVSTTAHSSCQLRLLALLDSTPWEALVLRKSQ